MKVYENLKSSYLSKMSSSQYGDHVKVLDVDAARGQHLGW